MARHCAASTSSYTSPNEGIRLAQHDDARHVRRVSIQEAPEIKQQHVSLPGSPLRGARVRQGTVWAGCGDRVERHSLCTKPKMPGYDLRGNLLLRMPGTDPGHEMIEDLLGKLLGCPDAFDFLRGLHGHEPVEQTTLSAPIHPREALLQVFQERYREEIRRIQSPAYAI